MEREPPEITRRLMRAARSLNYNRELQPIVAERIERAEGHLRGHLLAHGLNTIRLGPFQVDIDEEGAVDVEYVPPEDNWQQMPLPRASHEQQPNSVSGGTARRESRSEENGQKQPSDRITEKIVYGRT